MTELKRKMSEVQQLYKKNPEFRESRLKSLFSDFTHLKELNPEGYNANLNVWMHFLSTYFDSQASLSFDYDDLVRRLVYKTTSKTYLPEGLFIAINEMLNAKSVILLSELKENGSEKEKSSVLETIKWVLFGSERIDVRDAKYKDQPLVFVPKIEKYSSQIKTSLLPLVAEGPVNLNHLQSVLSRDNFKISKQDLNNTLLYLKKEMPMIKIEEEIIYSLSSNSTEEEDKIDGGELQHLSDLNYTIYKLHLYNNEKSKEIDELNQKVKESISSKNHITARSQLKLKKLLELQVQKTLASLENLHTLKFKLEDAHNNLLISKVMKDNSKVLKFLNEEATEKDLDTLFDTLYDEIQNADAVSDKLGQTLVGEVNEEEIEEDLMKLEASVRREEEEKNTDGSEVEDVRKKLDSLRIPENKPQAREENKEESGKQLEEDDFRKKESAVLYA